MAKAGFSLGFEPYERRDPVNGDTKTFMRTVHARQSSKRLKNFQRCVADKMRGQNFHGQGARQDSSAVRSAFTAAAKSCAGH